MFLHDHYRNNEQLSKPIFDLIKILHIDKSLSPLWKWSMLTRDWDFQHFHHLINIIEVCKTYTENFSSQKVISVVKTHLQCNLCPGRIF